MPLYIGAKAALADGFRAYYPLVWVKGASWLQNPAVAPAFGLPGVLGVIFRWLGRARLAMRVI